MPALKFSKDEARELYPQMCQMWMNGSTYQGVGEHFGVSPTTARQMIVNIGAYSHLATLCQRCGREAQGVLHHTGEKVCGLCLFEGARERMNQE